MKTKSDPKLSYTDFLNTEGPGRKLIHLKPGGVFFSQGTESNCVFYLISGRAKLTVVSAAGKEATITLLVPASSSEKNPSPARAACACPPPPHHRLHRHEDQSR
jgi:hypothetical protein